MRVLSYGGGTQSAALALMAAAGDLPPLDAVIFADTRGELPETYAYAEYVQRHVEAAGIEWVQASAGDLGAVLIGEIERKSNNPTPPLHIKTRTGEKGRVNMYRCSYDYKRRVITTATKRLCGKPGAWKRSLVEQWMGFSVDEIGRCKQDNECRCGHRLDRHPYGPCDKCECELFDRWRVTTFPLIDLGYRRGDTIRWFEKNNHPTPVRSACYFCPNNSPRRWQSIRDEHPDLFEKACRMDERNRTGGGWRGAAFDGELYWHSSLVPLRDADLRDRYQRTEDAGQLSMFDEAELGMECQAGVCFT